MSDKRKKPLRAKAAEARLRVEPEDAPSATERVAIQKPALPANKPAPKPPTSTSCKQTAEEIYKSVFLEYRPGDVPKPFGLRVIQKAEHVPLDAPDLANYLVLVWKAAQDASPTTPVPVINLRTDTVEILRLSRETHIREEQLRHFVEQAEAYAYETGLLQVVEEMNEYNNTISPTAKGWEIIKAFENSAATLPVTPTANQDQVTGRTTTQLRTNLPELFDVSGLSKDKRDKTLGRWHKKLKRHGTLRPIAGGGKQGSSRAEYNLYDLVKFLLANDTLRVPNLSNIAAYYGVPTDFWN